MIPITLRVHNFMCFRDNVPPVDLRGIHLACLAGDNGHGKSALLDAMTWALWGKARVSRDDQLIHQDQTEMEVELGFDLGLQRYRVIRKRDSRRAQSVLELQGWSDDRFRPLTEPTMRQTQAKIIDLIHMDYETFINSAFLVQGRADEFTTKPPGERKRILGEILGLAAFDGYAERSKAGAKTKALEGSVLDGQIREIDRELRQQPTYEAQLQEAEVEMVQLGQDLQAAEEQQKRLRMTKQTLLHQQQQLTELMERLQHGQQEPADIIQQLSSAEMQVASFKTLLDAQDEIEAGHSALVTARADLDAWNARLAAQRPLMDRRHQLEAAIAAERGELLAQQRAVEMKDTTLRAVAEEGEAQRTAHREARDAVAELEQRSTRRSALQQELTELASERAALETQNEQLHAKMADLKERIEMLQEAEQSACPLCQQPLDDAHSEQLLAEFRADGTSAGNQWRSNQARLDNMTERTTELRREDGLLERELRALPAQQMRLAQARSKTEEGEAAAAELLDVVAQLAALQRRLETQDYATADQERLTAVVMEVQSLGYDQAAQEAAKRRVAGLANWEEPKRELDLALRQTEAAEARVAALRKRQTRWQETMAADGARRDGLEEAVSRLPEVSVSLAAVQQRVAAVEIQERNARLRLGAARQRIDTCHRLVKDRSTKRQALQEASEERVIYEELQEAFGRRGLQAMIIEAVLPEIEAEANRLLSRMTDGRMTVRLETQRKTKAGAIQETLDINIGDELGPRSYDLFSGGEAFRVNFALRIAISKLLARRAGTQLRTLFIDEGFGTQDAQGRVRLVQAINTIKDDFDRILVITHIEELKDMFPVRIDVLKTSEGSQVSLS